MTQAKKERRQFGAFRIPAQLKVYIVSKNNIETKTLDISQTGILVACDHDQELNTFVRLRIYIPPKQLPIEILGRIANQRIKNGKKVVGIHFIELESKERNQWLEFVAYVEALTNVDKDASTAKHALQERRRTGRSAEAFVVRFKTSQGVEEFVTKNVSTGGMFLSFPMAKSIGEKITVVLVHPMTDKTFELEAEIIRLDQTSQPQAQMGMALRFVSMDESKKTELQNFIHE